MKTEITWIDIMWRIQVISSHNVSYGYHEWPMCYQNWIQIRCERSNRLYQQISFVCVSKWMHNNLFLNFYCLPAHILNKLSEFQMVNDPKYQMFKFLCQHTAIYTPFNGTLWLEFWRQNFAVQLIKLIKSAVCSTVRHIQWRQTFYSRISIESWM